MDDEARMYQQMYHILLRAGELALSHIKDKNYGFAEELLQEALLEAENTYVEWEEQPPKSWVLDKSRSR